MHKRDPKLQPKETGINAIKTVKTNTRICQGDRVQHSAHILVTSEVNRSKCGYVVRVKDSTIIRLLLLMAIRS
jgi:hypothetical protein